MKHTPGPWVKDWGVLYGSNGQEVVAAGIGLGLGQDNGDGNRKANARLIAAAPELLEALQAILSIDNHSSLTEAEADEINAKARAAIAKATGETQ